MNPKNQKVVLDTTYILPLYGIRVDRLKDLEKELIPLLNGKFIGISLYIPSIVMLEASYKLIKEYKIQKDTTILDRYPLTTSSITENSAITIINPLLHSEISSIALKIHSEGHDDLFDCLITAIAIYHNAFLITEDKELKIHIKNIPQYRKLQILDWKKFLEFIR